MIQNKENKAVW